MRIHRTLRRKVVCLAASISCALVTAVHVPVQSNAADQNVIAISGIVTGNVQGVGFRAMIQKQAIRYNLSGSAENSNDGSVRFILQGAGERIDQALKAVREGTKRSTNVSVSVSPASVDSNLRTFAVVGWTSVGRHISHPYDLIFYLRRDNAIIKKDEAKAIWLDICRKTVKGRDIGKCDKD